MTELREKIQKELGREVEVTFGSDDITVLIEDTGIRMSTTVTLDRILDEQNTVFSLLPFDQEITLDCLTFKQMIALGRLTDDIRTVAGIVEDYIANY